MGKGVSLNSDITLQKGVVSFDIIAIGMMLRKDDAQQTGHFKVACHFQIDKAPSIIQIRRNSRLHLYI